jgi:hypothetical protein
MHLFARHRGSCGLPYRGSVRCCHRTPCGRFIAQQITLTAGQNWCDDSLIHGLSNEINGLRSQRGSPALKMDALGMKLAEVRATEFIAYMSAHAPNSPGFNPHTGWDTTASRLGYDAIT